MSGNVYVTIGMLSVLEFVAADGSSPFARWFAELDAAAAAKVTTAVGRMELGNFSNVKGIGAGVLEYRIAAAHARWKDYKQRKSQEK